MSGLNDAERAFAQGRLEEAERLIRAHLRRRRGDPAAHYALGMVRARRDRPAAGLAAFQTACRLAARAGKPAPADWLVSLASAALDAGDPALACAALAPSARDHPGHPGLAAPMGIALQRVGEARQALPWLEKALGAAPGNAQARASLALTLDALGYRKSALDQARQALAQGASGTDLARAAVGLMIAAGDIDEAAALAARWPAALAEEPSGRLLLGQIAIAQGRTDAAAEHLRAALSRDPLLAEAHVALADLVKGGDPGQDEAIDRALEARTDPWPRRLLLIAKARILDARRAPAAAFGAYLAAATLAREAEKAAGLAYDPALEERFAAEIRAVFPAPLVTPNDDGAWDGAGLIFILGMPRSGTSLLEHMLAAHPHVTGAGELGEADALVTEAWRGGHGDLSSLAGSQARARLRAEYRARLSAAGTRFLVDKMPANYRHLGFIAAALPAARLIHARRDPVATCLSCFQQPFALGMQPFASGFETLAHAHRIKDMLMDHWRAALPGRVLDVDYEAVVADPETESKRLAAHVGVDWRAAMAAPHEQTRTVATASALQVRAPVHTGSLDRIARYGPAARPLVEALQAAGVAKG